MSSYNASDVPAKKGSPVVWIILGVVVLFVLPAVVCVGCCGGAAFLGFNTIMKAPPYVTAVERVQGNPEVVAKIGEPMTAGNWSKMNFNDAGGTADYDFQMTGPSGVANVSFNAVKENGAWKYTTFNVRFSDGSTMSLADDANATAPAVESAATAPAAGEEESDTAEVTGESAESEEPVDPTAE